MTVHVFFFIFNSLVFSTSLFLLVFFCKHDVMPLYLCFVVLFFVFFLGGGGFGGNEIRNNSDRKLISISLFYIFSVTLNINSRRSLSHDADSPPPQKKKKQQQQQQQQKKRFCSLRHCWSPLRTSIWLA